MANEFIARNGLIAQNNSTITGSLNVSGSLTTTGSVRSTAGFTGSLLGTASKADEVNIDNSPSQVIYFPSIGSSTAGYKTLSTQPDIYYSSDSGYFVASGFLANGGDFSGNLTGTATNATNAENATSASFAISSSRAVSSSFATSSSFALTASTTPQLYRIVNTADSSTISGSTALTLIYSQLIPANTFILNDIVRISYRGLKTGTAGTNSATFYVNTTNTVSGASLLGTFATTALVRMMQIDRKLYIKNVTSNTETYVNNVNSPYEYTNNPTIVFSNIAINWTVDQYLICANTLSNSADSFKGTSFEIERIRTT